MKQVNRDQFYEFTNELDVIIEFSPSNDSLFKMRHNNKIMGKIVDSPILWESSCGVNRSYFIDNHII